MDPKHQAALQIVGKALADTGYAVSVPTRTGVSTQIIVIDPEHTALRVFVQTVGD